MAAGKSSRGPRRGSRSYRALAALFEGPMIQATWMEMSGFDQSRAEFQRDVVQMLLRWQLVAKHGEHYLLLDAGLQYLGVSRQVQDPGAPAPGRYVPPMQPLSARHRHAPCVVRPGAFDYRDIPSRCADIHVPFKSSIKAEN